MSWTKSKGQEEEEAASVPAATNSNAAASGVRVYGFVPDPGCGDLSPACTKLMTFLKMSKTEYEYVPYSLHQFKGSPKGKVPWIHAPELLGDEPMGDSMLIINALTRADPSTFDLDSHLSKTDKAIGWAMKVMLEESLYWASFHVRWNTDELDTVTIPAYFPQTSWFFRTFIVGSIIKPKMLSQLRAQGTGLLSDDEVTQKAKAELQAVSDFLGTKTYIMGKRISSFDATVYAWLVGFIKGKWMHPIFQAARSHQNLVDYVNRMQAEFW